MLTLDTRSREPIYSQLEKQIIKLINLGVYEQDSPLPSVRSIACELGINPNTVARAYKDLEKNGVIYTVAGKGVFVCSTEMTGIQNMAMEAVKNAVIDAKNSGLKRSEVIDIVNDLWEDDVHD
ncbi:MAG: GntR family transcriptional regulator [Clostridium sp.]|nr:GntR family transcriptional regulator [Clostridium sp.]